MLGGFLPSSLEYPGTLTSKQSNLPFSDDGGNPSSWCILSWGVHRQTQVLGQIRNRWYPIFGYHTWYPLFRHSQILQHFLHFFDVDGWSLQASSSRDSLLFLNILNHSVDFDRRDMHFSIFDTFQQKHLQICNKILQLRIARSNTYLIENNDNLENNMNYKLFIWDYYDRLKLATRWSFQAKVNIT